MEIPVSYEKEFADDASAIQHASYSDDTASLTMVSKQIW